MPLKEIKKSFVMWKVRVFCFCICTACLLNNATCAVIGHEGETVIFNVSYPPDYEENSKYFGRSYTFIFEKLVQTNESNTWAKRGRFELFDNTTAHFLAAAILNPTTEDSGSYLFGVDLKRWPDPDTEIQLTVMKGKPKRRTTTQRPTTTTTTTTTTSMVIFHSTNSPLNVTAQKSESYPRFVAVLSLVCVCVLLLVCPFSLVKWANTCRLSVSVSYRTRKTSTQVIDEYVRMSPIVQSDKGLARDTDGDQIYTEMSPTTVHESVYQTIAQTTD